MDSFVYRDGKLFAEDVAVAEIAEAVGTPVYIYSKTTLLDHLTKIQTAYAEIETTICYSIKACGNINILKLIAEADSGFDIVSGGELFRAQQVGADPTKIVFAGVGKTKAQHTNEIPNYKTRETAKLGNNIAGHGPKKESMVYSGERQLLGIATMHKSNMVPVFADKKEDAKDIAAMRRN